MPADAGRLSAPGILELVRGNRNFRLLWYGQIVSQLGDWFSTITVQALLVARTGSATPVALYTVAAMLPGFLLGPVAGVVVDRLPRRAVMVAADLARAGIALGLLGFRSAETVWVAYACMAALSTCSAFFEPARIATLPNVTTREELVPANTLTSVTWSLLLTTGALAGGVVGRFLGPDAAFVLNACSFLTSAAFLARMSVPPIQGQQAPRGGIAELREGFAYVIARRTLRGALTAKLGWGLAGGIQVLMPILGQRVYPLPGDRNGQLATSILFAAGGFGTALGPLLARRVTGHSVPRLRGAITAAFLLGGLGYAAMSQAGSLWSASAALAFARFHGAIVWVFSTVLLQLLAEDRYRGRVFAAESSLFTGSMMASSLWVAWSLDSGALGIPAVMLLLAGASLVVGVAWFASLCVAARHGSGGRD